MELLTVKEAAQALRYSPGTVYRLVSTGALPATRPGTRGIRIKYDDLVRFVDSGYDQKLNNPDEVLEGIAKEHKATHC
jgi:excisionase family DNA binding protein